MTSRFQSLAEFWPHYLAEHRDPGDRMLHFLGTTWLFVCGAVAVVQSPLRVMPALVAIALVGWYAAARVERKRPAFAELIVVILTATLGSPVLLPLGILGGYGLAWIGHFFVEGNRPAAFRYPVWSFVSDFRVWGFMATGRLWSGDPAVLRRAA